MKAEGAVAEAVARLHRERRTIAVAESLTGGLLSLLLTEAPGSGGVYRGAVTAYLPEVKHDVLHVPPGPIVSSQCAAFMARGVAELLGADIGVATTGVAGPERLEDKAVGTVFVGYSIDGELGSRELKLSADLPPRAIREATAEIAFATLARELRSLRAPPCIEAV